MFCESDVVTFAKQTLTVTAVVEAILYFAKMLPPLSQQNINGDGGGENDFMFCESNAATFETKH